MKRRIDIEDRLDIIFAGRYVLDAVQRKAERLLVDYGRLAGLQPFDINSKKRLWRTPVDGCEPRLVLKIAGKKEEDTAVQSLLLEAFRKSDFEAEGRGADAYSGLRRSKRCTQEHKQSDDSVPSPHVGVSFKH
jgi:hypothetical protein